MRARKFFKVLILFLTLDLCAVIVWQVTSKRGSVHEYADEGHFVDPALLSGFELDRETVMELFPKLRHRPGRYRYDPITLVALKPDWTQRHDWPEHPHGRVVIRTNNMGFREDAPTKKTKTGPRVLVIGDSHADGVVLNAESFANILETKLNQLTREHPIEVINAAVGTTCPFNYVRVVRKNLEMMPDLIVASIFTGNDIMESLRLSDYFSKREGSTVTQDYRKTLVDASKRWSKVIAQGANQAFRFSRRPEERSLALDATVGYVEEMSEICTQSGIRLLVVLIPSKPEVEPEQAGQEWRDCLSTLWISEKDYFLNSALREDLKKELEARRIPCVDTTTSLRESGSECFWKKDYHLNKNGHAVVAEMLSDDVAAVLKEFEN